MNAGACVCGSLFRQWNGSDDTYPMFDARGNLRLLLDEDEEVVAECAPEGTGSDLPVIGATAMGNRFGGAFGYRDDGDIGLIHVGARYYDLSACRFITRDSYLDQHPYVYCYGDPINNVDPSGHWLQGLREAWSKVPGPWWVKAVVFVFVVTPLDDIALAVGAKTIISKLIPSNEEMLRAYRQRRAEWAKKDSRNSIWARMDNPAYIEPGAKIRWWRR